MPGSRPGLCQNACSVCSACEQYSAVRNQTTRCRGVSKKRNVRCKDPPVPDSNRQPCADFKKRNRDREIGDSMHVITRHNSSSSNSPNSSPTRMFFNDSPDAKASSTCSSEVGGARMQGEAACLQRVDTIASEHWLVARKRRLKKSERKRERDSMCV
jgi:hypothetical protein